MVTWLSYDDLFRLIQVSPVEVVSLCDVDKRMLANAVRAPSAGYTQGWAFLVLDQPEDVERFWATTTPESDRPEDRWAEARET